MDKVSAKDYWMYCAGLLAGHGIDVEFLNHIDKLLEAEEQGLLLKLPCKIGDEVKLKGCCEILYSFKDCPFEDSCEFDECRNGNEREFTTRVKNIYNEGNGWYATLEHIAFPVPIIDFGRTILLTEQLAHAALEKMKNE